MRSFLLKDGVIFIGGVVVRCNPKISPGVEVQTDLNPIALGYNEISDGLSLWFREGMGTSVVLSTWHIAASFVIYPELVAIIPVQVNSDVHYVPAVHIMDHIVSILSNLWELAIFLNSRSKKR